MNTTAGLTTDLGARVADEPPLGSRLGPFRLLRELGRGGSGIVYEAENVDTSARVALKVLRSPEPERIAGFKEEVRRISTLRHANLLVPFELLHLDGLWFFTMEFVDGTSLTRFVRDASRAPESLQVLESCFGQLISAIEALHSEGLLHLDLKPANVLVRSDGHVFVLDFGISRYFDSELEPERSSRVLRLGTAGYSAPEQWSEAAPVPESDWYSVGVMLFEALTDRLPGVGDRPSQTRDGVPEAIDEACTYLLAQEPATRVLGLERFRGYRSVHSGARRHDRLIGRSEELARLEEAFEEAHNSKPTAVLVRGAPGAGKTAVARCFLQRMRQLHDGVVVLSGRCYERESVPYKGLDTAMDALFAHLSRHDGPGSAGLRRAATQAALLFPILGALHKERVEVEAREPNVMRQNALEGVRDLIVHVARERLVIVFIDDVQWADRDTALMLNELFAGLETAKVLLLMTCRTVGNVDEPVLPVWEPLARVRQFRDILLPPLEPMAAVALAQQLVSGVAEAEEIARAADGNPFLIEELALRTHQRNTESDLWANLVSERMRALSNEALRVLKLTVLMGRPVEENLVWSTVGAATKEHLLAELRRHALVRTRSHNGNTLLESWHDRVQHAVRDSLPGSEAVAIHAELAFALERTGAPPAELAHHFRSSNNSSKALPYFKLAADEANHVFAFDRAAELYSSALELERAGSLVHADLVARLADCLFNAGRSAEAAPCFVSAAQASTGLVARKARVRAAEAYLLAGRIDEGFDLARSLAASLEHGARFQIPSGLSVAGQVIAVLVGGISGRARPSHDSELAVASDLYWTLAKGLIYVLPVDATDFLLRSLRLALRAGERRRVGRALGLLGAGMFMQIPALAKKGIAYLEAAARIGRELDDPYLTAMSEVWAAFGEVYPGHWQNMFDRSQRGLQLLGQHCVGVAWEAAIADGLSAWALQFMGRLGACEKYSANALQAARGRGDLYSEVMFSQYLAYAELAGGHGPRARERIDAIQKKWTSRSYTIPHFYVMLLGSMADLMDGEGSLALQRFQADRSAFLKSGGLRTPMSRIDYTALEARIHLSVDERTAKRAKLRSLADIVKSLVSEVRSDCVGHAAFVEAASLARTGRRQAALERWTASANAYDSANMVLHAACARLRGAELAEDSQGVQVAHAEIRTCGVADPGAWSRALMPSGLSSAA